MYSGIISWDYTLVSVPQCLLAQVLPEGMLLLAEPSPSALVVALETALTLVGSIDRDRQHRQVCHRSHCSHRSHCRGSGCMLGIPG